MTKKYRVSMHGLTRCPACARHVFLAENWKETQCKFCQAHLLSGVPSAEPTPPQTGRLNRSGLVAAGLLSMSLGSVGCMDDTEPAPSDQGIAADSATRDVGQTRLDLGNIAQPAYGAVAPDRGQPDAAMDAGIGPLDMSQPIDQPAYGAVAPDRGQPDAAIDAEIDAAPDPGPVPEYGAPPDDNE